MLVVDCREGKTNMLSGSTRSSLILLAICGLMAASKPSWAQSAAGAAAATQPSEAAAVKPFKPEELEQIVAQIALYPDSLLAQVFMASTYPLEVVQAERWTAENKSLKGDALAAELNKKDWDPSVKSLVDFPQVLTMMSKQLDWTMKLGDAFIADQKAVMDAVQRLRGKAQAAGNLKETPEQKIAVEPAPPQTVVVQGAPPPPPQIITIESKSPDVVYVPTYSPAVVYGTWPYPAYPPSAPYYPPGYVASNLISFGAGVAVGAAWGHAWGGCNWGHGEVDIDVDRNLNRNSNINRESARANIQSRSANRTSASAKQTGFQHDPAHRKGVSYRDQATSNRMGGAGASNASQARDSFRGRAETGRQDIGRGGADQFRGGGGGAIGGNKAGSPSFGDRGGAAAGNRAGSPSVSDRGSFGGGAGGRTQAPASARPSPTSGGAFQGMDRGGSAARMDSSRGASSRSTSSGFSGLSRSGGSSGASRSGGFSGGGGSRGGGASRGGGGGGRR